MHGPERQILDQYAVLGHKVVLGERGHPTAHLAPHWVPDEDRRRLTAYMVLAAYRENVSRWFYAAGTPADRDARREYGDAHVLVRRIVAGILGDDTEIVVEGADVTLPDMPDLPERPTEPAEDAHDIEKRIFALREQRWVEEATAIVDEWESALLNQPALRERQEWLRKWADDEHLVTKLHICETNAVTLGDGVYVLMATPTRPQLDVYDPGWYFPVLDDDDRGFPRKIHIAWEITRTDEAGRESSYVRRLTWELVDLPDGETRRYPWQAADEEPATTTCLFSDGTWPFESVASTSIPDLSESAKGLVWATTATGHEAHRLDLMVDMITVVHQPNTPSAEHFGASDLAYVAQLLDDLSSVDTDAMAAADLAALPLVAVFGANATDMAVRPGLIISGTEPSGRMDVLDLTASLIEVRNQARELIDRLHVNMQVPAEVVGRIKDSGDVIAGIAILLRLGPFRQLIAERRLMRTPKHRLILKYAQRLAQVMGQLPPGPNPVASIVPGAFLPSDLASVVETVVGLLQAHGISRRTALMWLVEAGADIGDLTEELGRIEREDLDAAVQLADATGSEEVAAKRLGVELPKPAVVADPKLTLKPKPDPEENDQ